MVQEVLELQRQRNSLLRLPEILKVVKDDSFTRLLMVYAITGLLFMILPGTFLGVWNLFTISKGQAADLVPTPWIQAHGHAQFFGWIGTFIIGIGFYSLPKLRPIGKLPILDGWLCWALWSSGVFLHWFTYIYQWQWQWQLILPLSSLLELLGFLIFFYAVSNHQPKESKSFESWAIAVISATVGMLVVLVLNLGESILLAIEGNSPIFPKDFNQVFLTFCVWAFLIPMVWGFTARWIPSILGLAPINSSFLILGLGLVVLGLIFTIFEIISLASIFFLLSVLLMITALGIFRDPVELEKDSEHNSFSFFVRLAYIWLNIAAMLGVWAALSTNSHGIWGASRHALTVGFLSTMIFRFGPRILPLFSGGQKLFSPTLVNTSLVLLNLGCFLRVTSQILAYQNYADWAWQWLPISAVVELTAMTLFTLNLAFTFVKNKSVVVVK